MLVPEFINAISMRFILNRDIWLAREGPSGIYNWVAFSTAQIVAEIPYAIIGGVVFFILYYFMIGLPLGFAAGYSFSCSSCFSCSPRRGVSGLLL